MSASTTATEEDTEQLRDLVAATLEKEGILGKIKAQLRAHVYLSLEGESSKSKALAQESKNHKLVAFLSNTNGRLVASLVREFLQFFDLDFSLAVFDPETNIGRDVQYRERTKLCSALGLTELTDPEAPLLSEIMRLSKVSVLKSESPTPSTISDCHTSPPASLMEDPATPEPTSSHQKEEEEQEQPRSKNAPVQSASSSTTLPVPQKSNSSFLTDLPPLGRSSLGDLPPLSMSNRPGLNLAPLKQPGPEPAGLITASQAKIGSGDQFKEAEKRPESKGSADSTPDVTENIEEELDSFLNSDISDANDITKDETLANSDLSLKADYVEAIKHK